MDRFDYLDELVFSPRTALLIKPQENHTFRVSYNRAYRSPSVINNFLDVTLTEPLPLGLINPAFGTRVYLIPIRPVGNRDLDRDVARRVRSRLYGRGGRPDGALGGVLREQVQERHLLHGKRRPALDGGEPAARLDRHPFRRRSSSIIRPQGFPASFTYKNFGETTQKGLELGVDTSMNQYVNLFANYSYQATPEPKGFDISELNLPPKNRFNVGASFTYARVLGNFSVSYSDDAFWQDVLDDRFHGTTEAYTLVNAGFGVRWINDQLTTSVKATNLGNQDVQQHVFGDVIKRQIVGELRVQF